MARDRDWFNDEILVEDENGTIVNDAVFKRNAMVCERLGIEMEIDGLTGTDNYSVNNKVEKLVDSGEGTCHLIASAAYSTASTTIKGLYRDLRELEYIDFDKPYWSQGLNEEMRIGDKQYICSGAALLSYYRMIFVTFFNFDMFRDANTELLYDIVERDEWTLEKQIELASVFYKDENGNGEADEGDTFGFMGNHDMIGVDTYWASCDLPIIKRNADGLYDYAIDQERTVAVIDLLRELFWECEGTMRIDHLTADAEQDDIAQRFAEESAAMVTLRLIEAENDLLEMDNYGIVPVAKYSTDQKGYSSSIHDTFSVYALPAFSFTDDELSMIGAFLEVMASESFKESTPAYYELALKGRYAKDPQSIGMLDTITQGVKIDAGFLYSNALDKPSYIMRDIVGDNLTTAVSKLTAKERIMGIKLRTLNESLEELLDN